jgi:uncharacterized protein (TIGR02145 family)
MKYLIMKRASVFLSVTLTFLIVSACKQDPSIPKLTTINPTDISYTTANSGGTLTDDGGAAIISKGICWSKNTNPNLANSKTNDGSGTNEFTSFLTGLSAGTSYFVRAYATNSVGTGYGNEINFSTIAPTAPVLNTSSVSSITKISALSGGNIISDGSLEVTARGICWSTSPNPSTNNNKTSDGIGLGSFTSSLSGLNPGTTYYLRAYATNSIGTGYGSEINFTTNPPVLATLTTLAVSSIGTTSVQCGGNISNDGGISVIERGTCWSTTPQPTIANFKTSDCVGVGSFTSVINNLSQGTVYYIRAFATNNDGTAYGNQISFITNQSDFDGNIYHPIIIGTQIWLKENLSSTHYQNGDAIPKLDGSTYWIDKTSGLYCDYNDDPSISAIYGRLYNWYAVNDSRNICPIGWHVATDNDWEILTTELGGSNIAGGRIKETGNAHWTGLNDGANNSSGFTALPAGRRFDYGINPYANLYTDTFFWTATEFSTTNAWGRFLYTSNAMLMKGNFDAKSFGFSIRCIRN